jgi:Fe2+ transport system protein FeoA
MINKFLNQLECGQKARIVKINLAGDLRRKLSDMGMVNGAEIQFERAAPLGDPLEIKVKGYALSLRKEIASQITVLPEDMKLTEVLQGTTVSINRIRGGHEAVRRLADMGCSPGTRITVIENIARGPLQLEVEGHRTSIGRGMADKIMVKEIADA